MYILKWGLLCHKFMETNFFFITKNFELDPCSRRAHLVKHPVGHESYASKQWYWKFFALCFFACGGCLAKARFSLNIITPPSKPIKRDAYHHIFSREGETEIRILILFICLEIVHSVPCYRGRFLLDTCIRCVYVYILWAIKKVQQVRIFTFLPFIRMQPVKTRRDLSAAESVSVKRVQTKLQEQKYLH